jgi:hypothetical protein
MCRGGGMDLYRGCQLCRVVVTSAGMSSCHIDSTIPFDNSLSPQTKFRFQNPNSCQWRLFILKRDSSEPRRHSKNDVPEHLFGANVSENYLSLWDSQRNDLYYLVPNGKTSSSSWRH